MRHKLRELFTRLHDASKGNLSVIVTEPYSESFWSSQKAKFLSSNFAGSSRICSGRLLGRAELSDLSKEDLNKYLRQISVAKRPEEGTLLRFDLQAGPGPAKVPSEWWGSENWPWRTAYTLTMAWGAHISVTEDASKELAGAAKWYEENKESVWRKWAPNTGAFMNAANVFIRSWKHDFYGEKYDKLLKIKHKYDPTESLWIYYGARSDRWRYDLHSGLLCPVDES